MSLDGLSFSNLGLYKLVSPVDATVQSEKLSQEKAEEIIKQTEALERVDADAGKEKQQQSKDNEDDTENNEEFSENEENSNIFKNENKIKKYIVNYNKQTNEVELINKKDRSIVESISPSELMEINKKFQNNTGFLIDKEG